jgi:Ca-activated chloride channel homolog
MLNGVIMLDDNSLIEITENDIEEIQKQNSVTINLTDLIEPPDSGKQGSKEIPIPWNPPPPGTSQKESVDIILAIDTSGSMGADDYKPNRLEAAKQSAKLFTLRKVTQNYSDRVAIIGFGGQATVVHPLDSNLENVLASIEKLTITHTGTLLGPAIQTAASELQQHAGKRRAIFLISDGADEYDSSDPIKIASALNGIKIFTIGIGTIKGGKAKLPHGEQQVYRNEKRLKQIAEVTAGEYLYAPDVPQLQRVYMKLADY